MSLLKFEVPQDRDSILWPDISGFQVNHDSCNIYFQIEWIFWAPVSAGTSLFTEPAATMFQLQSLVIGDGVLL